MRFEDKAGIVTGGSSGIGKAIAQRLASEGASLCLVAAPQDDAQLDAVVAELEETGTRVTGIAADVGDPATADRAVRTTSSRTTPASPTSMSCSRHRSSTSTTHCT